MAEYREPNWFFDQYARQRDEANEEEYGLTPYMIIAAKRLQLSKTSFAMVLQEEIMERGLGPAGREKFDFRSQFAFENDEFTEKWTKNLEWTPLTLDEPNRPNSSRTFQEPGQRALAEWIQTRAYEHRPSFFPLPHENLMDTAIAKVCTSEATIMRRGYAEILEFDPDLLNRRDKRRTPKRGTLSFRRPHPENWKEYMDARIAYNMARGELLRAKMVMANRKADMIQTVTHEQAVQVIMSAPEEFKENGHFNAIKTAVMLPGISQYAAQKAIKDVELQLRERERAEKRA